MARSLMTAHSCPFKHVLEFGRYFGCCLNTYMFAWTKGHIQISLATLINHNQGMCDEVYMLAIHSTNIYVCIGYHKVGA